jgi:hypothetical protein
MKPVKKYLPVNFTSPFKILNEFDLSLDYVSGPVFTLQQKTILKIDYFEQIKKKELITKHSSLFKRNFSR